MTKLWLLIDGAKTSLGIIAAGVAAMLNHFGYIDENTFELALIIIGTWTGVAIRSTLSKIQQPGTAGAKAAATLTSNLPSASSR